LNDVVLRAVNALAAFTIFGLTFLCVFGMALGGSVPFRGIWLPMGLGVAITLLLAKVPTLGNSWLRVMVGLAYAFGVMGFWARTQPVMGFTRWEHLARFASEGLLLCACVFGLFSLLTIFRRNRSERPPWLPLCGLILFGWIVAFFSSGKGGPDPMVNAFMRLFHVARPAAFEMTICVRKTIHFTFYGLTGLTAYDLARAKGIASQAVIFGLSVAVCQASFDELRQAGFVNRTGSFWDVLLDMAGASAFIWLASRGDLRSRREPQNTLRA
jgi:VanZ family protein